MVRLLDWMPRAECHMGACAAIPAWQILIKEGANWGADSARVYSCRAHFSSVSLHVLEEYQLSEIRARRMGKPA